jgi:acrylyl-CoA reductase (NADPH)
METFSALWLEERDGDTVATVKDTTTSQLPEEGVLVEVDYSDLNYKDALAVTGSGKIVSKFPFIPGIDFAGRVVESTDDTWSAGDNVVLTGWGVGERHFGGYSRYARVKPTWLNALPADLSAENAMIAGTAGLTAALCVQSLLDAGHKPEDGSVAVSGASGGVGSFAVALLAALGFDVYAITSKQKDDYLTRLGANNFLSFAEMNAPPRPLEKQRFIGAVDTLGNLVLARLLAEMSYGGSVACCGLASGPQLPTTVLPFILRGVRLLGIDSVMCPPHRRQQAWDLLAKHILPDTFDFIHSGTLDLASLPETAELMIANKLHGRYTVKL